MDKFKYRGISIISLIGITTMAIFWYLFGGMMLLRYILSSILFATITVSVIKILNKTWGRKRLFK
jgi:hypothetical protein